MPPAGDPAVAILLQGQGAGAIREAACAEDIIQGMVSEAWQQLRNIGA